MRLLKVLCEPFHRHLVVVPVSDKDKDFLGSFGVDAEFLVLVIGPVIHSIHRYVGQLLLILLLVVTLGDPQLLHKHGNIVQPCLVLIPRVRVGRVADVLLHGDASVIGGSFRVVKSDASAQLGLLIANGL